MEILSLFYVGRFFFIELFSDKKLLISVIIMFLISLHQSSLTMNNITINLIEQIYDNNMSDLLIPENTYAHIIDRISDEKWTKQIIIEEHAQLTYLLICENSEIDLEIVCEWEFAQAKIFAIFVGKENSLTKASVFGNLRASETSADMYLLSLLGNNSNIAVDWGVDIGPGILQASGHLLEENLILGEKIQLKTLPMLDVRSNDVSASHGCKIDRVDANKLFYMTSKGIPKDEANRLIVEGYVANVLENFKDFGEDTILAMKDNIIEKVI